VIREVIRPQGAQVTINIPESYIDREIEFIMFPLDESLSVTQKSTNVASLKGVFASHVDKEKRHLEESAWQKHVVGHYE
jgi:hypothetical protein